MTETPSRAATARVVAVAVAVHALSLVVSALHPNLGAMQIEEPLTTGLAVASRWVWPWHLFAYTDVPRCGGCWVDAVLAGPATRVLPEVAATWRGVAIAWQLAYVAVVAGWLHRRVGTPAAAIGTVMVALAPASITWLQLHAIGNHMEASVLGVATLAAASMARGPRGVGVAAAVGGLAVFVSLSAAPLVGVGALWVVWMHRRAALLPGLAGFALGSAPWLGRLVFDPRSPVPVDLLVPHEGTPIGWSKAAEMLSAGRQGAWWAAPELGTLGQVSGVVVAAAVVTVLVRGPHATRPAALAFLASIATYLTSPLYAPAGRPESIRYLLAAWTLAPVIVPAAAWTWSRWGRGAGAVPAVVVVLAGAMGHRVALRGGTATAHLLDAPLVHAPIVRAMDLIGEGRDPAHWHCGDDARCGSLRAVVRVMATPRDTVPAPVAPERPEDIWTATVQRASRPLGDDTVGWDDPVVVGLRAAAVLDAAVTLDGVRREAVLTHGLLHQGREWTNDDVDFGRLGDDLALRHAIASAQGYGAGFVATWSAPRDVPPDVLAAWSRGAGWRAGLSIGALGLETPPAGADPAAFARGIDEGRTGLWMPWREAFAD